MPHKNKILRFFLIVITSLSGFPFDAESQQFFFEKFSVDEGLSQSEISAITEDKNGFLWMGTRGGGVCRFDGSVFTVYDERNGIAGDIIETIKVSPDGKLYLGSSWGGFTVYDGIYFRKYLGNDKAPPFPVKDFAFGPKGEVYYCNAKQVVRFHFGKYTVLFEATNENQVKDIRTLYFSPDGVLYFQSLEHIGRVVGDDCSLYTIPGTTGLTCITKGLNDKIYVGTFGNGLFSFESAVKDNIVFQRVDEIPVDLDILSIHYQDENSCWINAGDFGVLQFTNTGSIHVVLTKNNGLDAVVNCVYGDVSGTIWFGTSGSGLYKLRPPKFMNYLTNDGPDDQFIMAIAGDTSGKLWLGSTKNGLIQYDNQTKEVLRITTATGLPTNEVRGIYITADNKIWAATSGGLCVIVNGKVDKVYNRNNGYMANYFRCVTILTDGTVMAGTMGDGLILIKDGVVKNISTANSDMPNNNVHYILQDKKGVVWIGTSQGLVKYENERLFTFGVKEGLCNSYVGNIAEDNNGNIWFSTDRCVGFFDGSQIKTFDRADGLGSNTCYFIKADKNNQIWVGTNTGLDRLQLSSYSQIEKITHYKKNDGFVGTECNSRAIYEDTDGKIYFGTIKGLIRYQPTFDITPQEKIKPLIYSMTVLYGESSLKNDAKQEIIPFTRLPKSLVLSPGSNNITFEFTAPAKNEPWNISYSYFLKGLDKVWSPAEKTHTATYINLPAGQYTFMVKMLNQHNEIVGTVGSYTFTINPPFWKTPIFFIFNLVVLIVIIVYFNIRRTHKQELEKVILEKKVRQRTIELLAQKDERELLLKEIHHRVKNNLQVINSLINLQSSTVTDPLAIRVFDECKLRIKSMALIHEKFYQSQDFSRINLKEYIEGLAIDIMAGQNLHKNIKLEVDVDQAKFGIDTIIPLGLLLNETLTNSFKYAFKDQASGEIYISLKKIGIKDYEMHISDNGSGFNHMEFNKPNSSSLGFELIRILSEQMNGTIELLKGKGTIYKLTFSDMEQERIPKNFS
ncbi:MAG: two-component regulator propeller domain-containing protein [Flavobacteriales bacterium]